MANLRLRIAADIGGTFTDIALFLPDGRLATRKVPSTPDDYSRGVIDGIRDLVDAVRVEPGDIAEVLHGCTIATNAIVELKGARTALLTTRGFRDVLELRRIRVPRLYDPLYVKPAPLVPRNLRFEVSERVGFDGAVVLPLDENDVHDAIERLRHESIESVAVCFLHSYVNPAHERRVGEMLRAALPQCFVSLSVDVLPEIREYERTSTTVINAYVGPPVARYIRRLRDGLRDAGFSDRLLVMQSSGGTLDAEAVLDFPARIVECGPAAGVIGAAYTAAASNCANVITFDMGGTTAKASLIEDGHMTRTDEYEVGGGISLSSRLLKGGGYALKLPVIDISEVGAGGGSIVRVDKAGAVKVGPDSAGAIPGPACYAAGGEAATVTDANVVLGFLNAAALAGGSVPIRADLSRKALAKQVAAPLDMPVEDAAWSVFVVATANMVRAVKSVSTYRGRNPSDFVLIAFGGNGGVFATELLRQLQMKRAVIPPAAGVLSAVGLCVGDVQFSQSQAFLRRLDAVRASEFEDQLARLVGAVMSKISVESETPVLHRRAAVRYVGQAFELSVPIPDGPITEASLAELQKSFETEHARTYGHSLDGFQVEIVALDVSATVNANENRADNVKRAISLAAMEQKCGEMERRAYFGPDVGWIDTPVIQRTHIAARGRRGPLIIEDYEGTAIVPPDGVASLDEHGNIVIELGVLP